MTTATACCLLYNQTRILLTNAVNTIYAADKANVLMLLSVLPSITNAVEHPTTNTVNIAARHHRLRHRLLERLRRDDTNSGGLKSRLWHSYNINTTHSFDTCRKLTTQLMLLLITLQIFLD